MIPYSYLMMKPSFQKVPHEYYLQASMLGKSQLQQFLFLCIPLNARSIFISFAVGVAISCNLYLPSFFAGGLGQIPLLINEVVFAFQTGNHRLVSAVTQINIILPFVAMFAAIQLYKMLSRHRDV